MCGVFLFPFFFNVTHLLFFIHHKSIVEDTQAHDFTRTTEIDFFFLSLAFFIKMKLFCFACFTFGWSRGISFVEFMSFSTFFNITKTQTPDSFMFILVDWKIDGNLMSGRWNIVQMYYVIVCIYVFLYFVFVCVRERKSLFDSVCGAYRMY